MCLFRLHQNDMYFSLPRTRFKNNLFSMFLFVSFIYVYITICCSVGCFIKLADSHSLILCKYHYLHLVETHVTFINFNNI